jgi:hypothetical protein
LLGGCATAEPVIRVYPADADVVWRSGRGIMERRLNGARVAMAFERGDEDWLAFRVEVENTGPDRVDIDTTNLAHVTCIGAACQPQRAVLDPERALIAIDSARSRERAVASNEAAVSGVLMLLSMTADVSAVASGNGREASRFGRNTANIASDAERSADQSEDTIDRLGAERVSWEAAALRRTTLFPGQAVAAEIYVPVDPRVTTLRVGVRVRQESCWFPFREVALSPWGQTSPGAQPARRTSPHDAFEADDRRRNPRSVHRVGMPGLGDPRRTEVARRQ